MVIDLTYLCNFTCHYCQWGDPTNEKRKNVQLEKLLVKSESLKDARVSTSSIVSHALQHDQFYFFEVCQVNQCAGSRFRRYQ